MLYFWVTFLFFSIFAIPMIITIITMMDTIKQKIAGVLFVVFFWFATAGCCCGVSLNNADKWNDGYCKCGTHWELKGASQYRSSHTKYYACPNCYAEIEINH